jgi:DNA-binding transcriptional LysR family regulator
MRMKDLRIVTMICRTGSFSKAADALRITQPAVSQAVKRVETELEIRIFERASSPITLSADGATAVKAFEKVLDMLDGIRANGEEKSRMRIGVTPLLSGRDVTRLLNRSFAEHQRSFDVEFLDSHVLSGRADFDIKIVVPTLRRRATYFIDLTTTWIGAANGIFIYSRQEAEIWDRARFTLLNSDVTVTRVIEVNDCGYAYHMASSGAGFTPCVMTAENSFRSFALAGLPPLPNIRLDIFAPNELARELRANLADGNTPAGDPARAAS